MYKSRKRWFVLLIAIALIASLLSACGGPSATDYANKVQASLDTYGKTFQTAGDTISSAKTADDMKSQDYKDRVATALSALEAAGKDLGSIPDSQVPTDYKDFNAVLVQISDQTSTSVAEINAALQADDLNQLSTAASNMQKIVDLLNQAQQKMPK